MLVKVVINAVMEIIIVEFFEMGARIGSGKQQAAYAGEGVHRTADVHQQQYLDGVFPAPSPDEFDIATLAAVAWIVSSRSSSSSVPYGEAV